tara:strand:- start:1799 stop:2317 length:519 start_codon:yes stop_codon:yes gene_type:complete
MRFCSKNVTPTEPRIERDTIVEYVTVTKETPVYIPKIKYINKIDIDTFLVYNSIDTLSILADYYSEVYYDDEQNLDSLYLTILDTVSQNMITGRQIKYTLKYPKTTITEKIYINQRQVYAGLGIQGLPSQLNYVGGEILYKNKKNQIYGFGGGINQNFQPIISVRMYWKIGK